MACIRQEYCFVCNKETQHCDNVCIPCRDLTTRMSGLLEPYITQSLGLPPIHKHLDFETELRTLLNRHSKENASNTPDFVLARYLAKQLELFNETMEAREKIKQ